MKLDWWNLWIPFLGTIFGILGNVFINYRQNKNSETFKREMSTSQQQFQEKMVKQQIDADLKATARIQWIQEVRKYSALVITGLSASIENPLIHNPQGLMELKKNAELLMLYFSSKSSEQANESIAIVSSIPRDEKSPDIMLLNKQMKDILYNQESNKGKNEYIKEYIKKLVKYFTKMETGTPPEILYNEIEYFREVVSIYLKIEWDKAKEGE